MTLKQKIQYLKNRVTGLSNDARYWDLCRAYGEFSPEVYRHLSTCREAQTAGVNHT